MSVVTQLLQQAQTNLRASDLAGAHALCNKVMERDTRHPEAWRLLGAILARLGRRDAARQAILQSIGLAPDNAGAHSDLGDLERTQGRLPEAVESYRRAAALDSGQVEVWMNLGETCRSLGRHAEALSAYRRVAALMANNVNALVRIAELEHLLLHFTAAEAAARRACALEPGSAIPYLLLSNALAAQNKDDEVLLALEQALRIDPDSEMLLTQIARTFEHWRAPDRAAEYYERLLAVDPENAWARCRLIDTRLSICDWSDYEAFCASLVRQIERAMATESEIAFDISNLLAFSVDPSFVARVSRYKAAWIARQLQPRQPQWHGYARKAAGERIRLGYLLPYTVKHSMPLALWPVIEQHDRRRFEVFGYSLCACDGSPTSVGLRGCFDRFTDVIRQPPEQAAAQLHADGIDLLIDTTGHTNINWLAVLALRPAPVQVHYLGYSLTSGADYVDYLISDRNFIPPSLQGECSEAPVYLPDSFMATARMPIDPERPSRAAAGLPETGVVFANFNQPMKLEPVIFGVWMRILHQVPGSVLWFGEWNHRMTENLRRFAAAHGIDGERLVFAPLLDHPQHLARLQLADLVLDNRLHGGGVTSVDALWAGVPVLSAAGAGPAARLGATLNAAAGQPEMTVRTLAEYETLAVDLARDPARLRALSDRLRRGRDGSALFDQRRYRRHLERAYEMIWADHLAGRPRTRIDVPPAD